MPSRSGHLPDEEGSREEPSRAPEGRAIMGGRPPAEPALMMMRCEGRPSGNNFPTQSMKR